MDLNCTPQLKASVHWSKHSKEKRHPKNQGTSYTEKYYITLLIGASAINADTM